MAEDWTNVVLRRDNIDALYYSFTEESVIVNFKGGSVWKYVAVPQNLIQSYEGELTTKAVLEALRHNNIVGIRVK